MAKKKVSNVQSQSLNNKTQPQTIDDSSVQIQNLKNLNSVLLKETSEHRKRIQSLLKENNTAVDSEALASERNIALEVENSVFAVFAKNQIGELGFLFGKVVEERDERKFEVDVEREKVRELGLGLEKERGNVEKLVVEVRNLVDERDEKVKRVEEVEKGRDLVEKELDLERKVVRKVVEDLKVKVDLVVKDRNEIENVKRDHEKKIGVLEFELKRVNDVLKSSKSEEAVLRGKIVELEGAIGVATEKEREMKTEYNKLVREKKEMEKSIKDLTEGRDRVNRTLDMVQRELENRQREVDEANRARDEIDKVKVSRDNEIVELKGEVSLLGKVVDELKSSCKEVEEKSNVLLSQVHHYRNAVGEMELERDNIREKYDEERNNGENLVSQIAAMEEQIALLRLEIQGFKRVVDEVELERDNIRKGYDEEKNKVKNLESQVAELKLKKETIVKGYNEETKKVENLDLQIAGLKEKIENAEAELVKIRSEKEKVNKTNKKLESRVDVLIAEKDATQSRLIAAQRERDELKAKFESSCITTKQALELLKSTSSAVVEESVEVVAREKKEHGEEVQSFAEELEAIKKAFKVKNEIVDEMKQQVVSLQKSVSDAHKGKTLWTGISSATTILAAVLTAYIAKGH